MNPKSKQQRIKKFLKNGGRLTPMQALKRFGCFRLAAVVKRLKDEHGMWIENIGEPGKHAKYIALTPDK